MARPDASHSSKASERGIGRFASARSLGMNWDGLRGITCCRVTSPEVRG